MQKWAVQDAKNQFSRVVELATTEGPQTITRHGKDVVVVVSVDQFRKLNRPEETPLDFFSRLKGLNLNLKRRKDLPRKISL